MLALWLAGAVQAQSLAVLLERARSGEPTYLGAKTNVLAAQARNSQAIGAMLPQVSATASSNDNDRNYKTRNSSVPEARERSLLVVSSPWTSYVQSMFAASSSCAAASRVTSRSQLMWLRT